ncbi:MAG: DUF4426 domain-containing protein [Gammaproteobacteria bacterium]|nr:DUF4426 domain-containing protein [Gammaproteobacteria bacterium]
MFYSRFITSATIILGIITLVVPTLSHANQHSIGDVTIHYNALNSADIPAEVAASYKIDRNGRTGIINIAVFKNDQPVVAHVFGHGKNLLGQLKDLAFKEIREEQAIYYIATYTFSDAEEVFFELNIQADKTGSLIPISFKKQLFRPHN